MYRWTLTLTFLLLPGVATAATLVVATSGRDSNPCTADAPCRTVGHATGRMQDGDTVLVHGGTYTEGNISLPSGRAGAPSTLLAARGETVTLQPNDRNVDCLICLYPGQSYITIDGLVLDAGSPSGERLSFGAVVNSDHNDPSGHHFTIQNCEVKNARQQGLHIAGAHWTVANNHIHHNGTDPHLHHGIYFSGHESLITGNFLHDNTCFAVQNYSATYTNTSNNTYRNNTFTHNGCGVVLAQGSGHVFANNILYNDGLLGRTPGAFVCCASHSEIAGNTIVNNPLTGLAPYNDADGAGTHIHNNTVCGNSGEQLNPGQAVARDNDTAATCPEAVMQRLAQLQRGAGRVASVPAPLPLPIPRNMQALSLP